MVWLERTKDGQRSFKTPEMDERIVWSDNGIAQTTKDDAEIAIDYGVARKRNADSDDEDADDENEGNEQNEDNEDGDSEGLEAVDVDPDEPPEPSRENE